MNAVVDDLKLILPEVRAALVRCLGSDLVRAYLYGSCARGEQTPDSDIDVLVIVRDESARARLSERTSEAIAGLCLKHDTVISRVFTFQMIEEYFREEKIVLHSLLDLGNMEAIKELVKLGLGISILAPWTAKKEIEAGSLVTLPLGRRKLKRRWGVLHWKNQRLNLAQETFIRLCESVSERFG